MEENKRTNFLTAQHCISVVKHIVAGIFLILRNLLVFGLQSLEGGNRDEGNQGVELVWRVFILIASTGKTNTDSEGYTPAITTKRLELDNIHEVLI